MTGVTEDELMRAHRPVRLDDLTEMDQRRLMHERIRRAEDTADRLRVERDEWREEAQSLRREEQCRRLVERFPGESFRIERRVGDEEWEAWCPPDTPMGSCIPRCGDARCEAAASPDERLREALALVYVMLTGAEPMWAEMPLDERCARAANEAQQAFLAADREAPNEPKETTT